MSTLVDWISIAFQCIASLCWAIGAGIASPEDASDYLQFIAAIAWCVANIGAVWAMLARKTKVESALKTSEPKTLELYTLFTNYFLNLSINGNKKRKEAKPPLRGGGGFEQSGGGHEAIELPIPGQDLPRVSQHAHPG